MPVDWCGGRGCERYAVGRRGRDYHLLSLVPYSTSDIVLKLTTGHYHSDTVSIESIITTKHQIKSSVIETLQDWSQHARITRATAAR
jgi:hypothetical protein